MNNLLAKLRTIPNLNVWTDTKLLEVFNGIDISNLPTYKIIQIAHKYARDNSSKKLSVYSKEFYIIRGWTHKEAENKVYTLQVNNNAKYTEKRKANPEKYKYYTPFNIEYWLNRGYSYRQAKFEVKKNKPVNIEYWSHRGHSMATSIELRSNYQTKQSNKFLKKQKENPSQYYTTQPTRLDYWLLKTNGNLEEAKKLLRNRQSTFTLSKNIKKYGKVEGTLRWKARQDRWKQKVFNADTNISGGFSKKAINFFTKLKDELTKLEIKYTILDGKNEKFINDGTSAFKYDFTVLENRKIIEFNGDFWHCNPSTHNGDYFHPIKKMTASSIWEYDEYKRKLAEKYNYKVLTIWEKEYTVNPDIVLNTCLNFIQND